MESVTASEMLEEFRLMEGTLFQDEEAKLFYLDIKEVVLDSLVAAWDKFSSSDVLYQTALDRYYSWEGAVGHEEVERCMTDVHNVHDRHFHVAVFYSRQLYGNEDFNKKIVIAKPKIEVLLKTFFRRLVRNLHVKSGSFFNFDPVKQDFILRDAFRQALAESIKVVDTVPVKSTKKKETDLHSLTMIEDELENVNEPIADPLIQHDRAIDKDEVDTTVDKPEAVETTFKDKEIQEETVIQAQDQEKIEDKDEKEKIQHDIGFDVKQVEEDYNVGDSISVFLDSTQDTKVKSSLKIPKMVRTVVLS
jgi:hypothetical protein